MRSPKDKSLKFEVLENRVLFSVSPAPASPPDAEPPETTQDSSYEAPSGPETNQGNQANTDVQLNNPGDVTITTEQVETIAAAAAEIWEDTGITAEQKAALEAISYEVTDLAPGTLAFAEELRITFDVDASGNGWFIDPTPLENEEFTSNGLTTFVSLPDSDAEGNMDLLTIMLHEQGHVLGLPDISADGTLMYEFLATGERRLPESGILSTVQDGELEGTPDGTSLGI